MVKYHYKCCSRDSQEVETDEEDNNKHIIQQLPALVDDKNLKKVLKQLSPTI